MTTLWRYLLEHFSSYTLYSIFPSLLSNLAYFAAALFGLALDKLPALQKYKIQQKSISRAQFWKCVKYLAIIKLGLEIPLALSSYTLLISSGISAALPLPSVAVVAAQLAMFLIIEDAWHYFAHRVLHTRWVYKNVHHIHHRYATPFGMMANYVHPAETMWTGFGTILPVLIFGPHLFTMWLWITLRQLLAVVVHIGYRFPISPSSILPFMGGAPFHDRHHAKYNYNYAPMFTWLDTLFGTTWPGSKK